MFNIKITPLKLIARKDKYVVYIGNLLLNNKELSNVFDVNINDIVSIVEKYNGKIDYSNGDHNSGYNIFANIADATKFANWLESLYIVNKLSK